MTFLGCDVAASYHIKQEAHQSSFPPSICGNINFLRANNLACIAIRTIPKALSTNTVRCDKYAAFS